MKNKIIALLLFNFVMTAASYGQQSAKRVVELKKAKVVRLLASLDTVVTRSSEQFGLHIYSVANKVGKMRIPETDEVSHQILIAVSNGDERPEQHLFKLGDFYNPKIVDVELSADGTFILSILYGSFHDMSKVKYQIYLSKVVIYSQEKYQAPK